LWYTELSESLKIDSNLGELFRQSISVTELQSGIEPYDPDVADLCIWFDEFKQNQNLENNGSDNLQALNTFLRQYVDTHGVLPPKHDLHILQDKFGYLPDWLSEKPHAKQS
jgi:hypothetical protein